MLFRSGVTTLYLSGGSCALPGVRELFAREFPQLDVLLPSQPLFLTPLSIAAYRSGQAVTQDLTGPTTFRE